MSKTKLTKYLQTLKKKELELQIIDLYERFSQVKTFYDFAFNPKEDKLLEEAKVKIYKEYFPQTRRRPKARRSVAQNFIKHFRSIGLDPALLAELMLYNLDVAQDYAAVWQPSQAPFYKSMHVSFKEAVGHCLVEGLLPEHKAHIARIAGRASTLKWMNADRFEETMAALNEGRLQDR